MLMKTLLNRVHPVKGFVYQSQRLVADSTQPNGVRMEVDLRARGGSKAACSGCGKRCPSYDRLPKRGFDFVPLWGIAVVVLYALRRVDCPGCGVKVELVPWCEPGCKSPTTISLRVFLRAGRGTCPGRAWRRSSM